MRAWTFGAAVVLAWTAVAALGSPVRADGEFSVKLTGRELTVHANAPWHINTEYRWRVLRSGKAVEGADVHVTAAEVSVKGLPAGVITLKGAVCVDEGDRKACVPFAKDLAVPD